MSKLIKERIKILMHNDRVFGFYLSSQILFFKLKIIVQLFFAKYFNKNVKVVTNKDLLSQCGDRRIKNVHVIGSGWSIMESLDSGNRMQSEDFIIGFNYSGLLHRYLKFNLYFFEFGGHQFFDTVKDHLEINSLLGDDCIKVFKNLWGEKNNIKSSAVNWGGQAYFVTDVLPHCISEQPNIIRKVLLRALDSNDSFLYQISSTAITSIIFAYHMGAKNIIIHGVDFGGQYFYETSDFICNNQPLNLNIFNKSMGQKQSDLAYSMNNVGATHPTSQGKVTINIILEHLNILLRERGVCLYSGSSKSPLSQILPIYLECEDESGD
ncbi:hypothetical protein FQP85_08680 [Pseudoalteromonas neustonica]|uniref:DUF115 domain-containing protein n=1 Tax=Pseudoalteromonas neustonica TaxID=1840331 RepID=A0ABY3FEY3_9GAMM|nr:hypothetical protein [Pseudoalteromonas neustonica]TVU83840.1 hypothetical protein FQP85_08680 [Pseudoalteromonas neustonica]